MAEKKKILYIVEAMGGGVFTYIVDLANELVNKYDMYIAYAVRKQTPKNYKDYPFTVFTLGRICYQKNPTLFNTIAELLPDVRFVWIGDGELREELKSKNIEISGWVDCTGSDQVWNSKWNNGILPCLYLSFVPNDKYKFAFSASFGQSKLSTEEINKTKPYLEQYNRISVREKEGEAIVKEQYHIENCVHLVDPTLCVSGDFWRKYESKRKIKSEYILVYNLNRSKEFDRYAVELSRRTGLKLVRFCTRYDQFYRPGKSMLVPEVFDFISLIDNAKYVLTDSFHATAFSLNLHL